MCLILPIKSNSTTHRIESKASLLVHSDIMCSNLPIESNLCALRIEFTSKVWFYISILPIISNLRPHNITIWGVSWVICLLFAIIPSILFDIVHFQSTKATSIHPIAFSEHWICHTSAQTHISIFDSITHLYKHIEIYSPPISWPPLSYWFPQFPPQLQPLWQVAPALAQPQLLLHPFLHVHPFFFANPDGVDGSCSKFTYFLNEITTPLAL